VKRPLLAGLLLLVPAPAWPQGPEKVIDVRAGRPPAGNSFEALWSTYRKAEQRGDAEGQQAAVREIRRLRIERNIRSLEPLALSRVGQGVERLERGERDRAEEDFRGAAGLDPHLADAHYALALAELRRGPVGFAGALRHTLAAVWARLPTIRGRYDLSVLLAAVGLVTLLATTVVVALTLLLRHAGLLRHDFEEAFAGRRTLALTLTGLVLLLPVVAFQGWGWLPLWILAVLFIYMDGREKAVACILLACSLFVAPLARFLEARARAQRNPLFEAGVASLESGPDTRAALSLEESMRANPDDRDLVYLLATQYRKAGRYEEAANLYREVLRQEPNDAAALNNLGNLEFAAGEYQAAIARYKQGLEAAPPPAVGATFYYNLSLAHLQRFEYQPAQEARSQADRLDSGLIRSYDGTWKYDKGDYAVVDLRPTPNELWAKFLDQPQGLRLKNVAGRGGRSVAAGLGDAFLNRFTAFLAALPVVVFIFSRWRGRRMFTRRCVKCGTPFCRRCQLGTAAGALCTQCHHLFVVRDGVSGPARNQKLLEVQKEDERRDRVFRVLSLAAPGAGHVYAQQTWLGVVLVALWALLLSLALLAGRLLPWTEASSTLSRPWGLALAGAVLLAVYVTANRARPEVEIALPPPRRGYAA
jgi:tetratricopeptide (TPR) repeat protein